MNKQFLQANLGNLVGFVVLVLSYIFHINQYVSPIVLFTLILISLCVYRSAYEYQRITLTIARCVKLKTDGVVSIFDIQGHLSSSIFSFVFFLESVIFGIIVGYLLRTNIVYLIVLMIVKYVVIVWIPIQIPHRMLFSLIEKELVGTGRALVSLGDIKSMVFLVSTFKEMPHDKTYETWAFTKYGNSLLAQK